MQINFALKSKIKWKQWNDDVSHSGCDKHFSVRSFSQFVLDDEFKLAFSYVNSYSKPMEVKIESGQ